MDRLNALRIFCSVADTLQFRETATRLAISPQVISRIVGELEEELGESLFQRSTRQVQLTDFGRELLPQARLAVQQADEIFSKNAKASLQEMSGTVRVSVPDTPVVDEIAVNLMQKLAAYPDLQIDWRSSMKKLNVVDERIDIGLRFGLAPSDNSLIVKRVADVREVIAAAPALLEKYGTPKTFQDLSALPLAVQVDINSGRTFAWLMKNENRFLPSQPRFTTDSMRTVLHIALAAQAAVCLHKNLCRDYLQSGELVEILPETDRTLWGAFLYRPNRNITPPRIKKVFELLGESVGEVLGG